MEADDGEVAPATSPVSNVLLWKRMQCKYPSDYCISTISGLKLSGLRSVGGRPRIGGCSAVRRHAGVVLLRQTTRKLWRWPQPFG